MIAYLRCACTTSQKLKVQQLIKQGYEVRLTRQSHLWRKEAALYNVPVPFIVTDESKKLGEPLHA